MTGERPRRTALGPDPLFIVLIGVVLLVGAGALWWTEVRVAQMEERLGARIAAAARTAGTGSAPAASPSAPVTATPAASSSPAAGPTELARFVTVRSGEATALVRLALAQKVEGDHVAEIAASYGDVPYKGAYILDTGERFATRTVAVRCPVTVSRPPAKPAPRTASELAAALDGPAGRLWRRCYFLITRDGDLITGIVQADAPLRARD